MKAFSASFPPFPSELVYNGEVDKRKFFRWEQHIRTMISKDIHLIQEQTSIDAKPQLPRDILLLLAAGQPLNAQQTETKFKCDDRIKLFENNALEAIQLFKTSVGQFIKSDLLAFWNVTPDVLVASLKFPRMFQQTVQKFRGTPAQIQAAVRSIEADIVKLANAKDDHQVQLQFISLNEYMFELASFGQEPMAIERLQTIATVILEDNIFQFERTLINTILNPPTSLSDIIAIWSTNAEKNRRFGQVDITPSKMAFSASLSDAQNFSSSPSSQSSMHSPAQSSSQSPVQSVGAVIFPTHQQQEIDFLRKLCVEKDEEIFKLKMQIHHLSGNAKQGGGGGQRWQQQPITAATTAATGQQHQLPPPSQMPRYFQPRLPPRQPPPQFHPQFQPQFQQQHQPQFQQQQQQHQQRFHPPFPRQPPPPTSPWDGPPPPRWAQQQQFQQRKRRPLLDPSVSGASIEVNEQANNSSETEIYHGVGMDEITPDQWPTPDDSSDLPADYPF